MQFFALLVFPQVAFWRSFVKKHEFYWKQKIGLCPLDSYGSEPQRLPSKEFYFCKFFGAWKNEKLFER